MTIALAFLLAAAAPLPASDHAFVSLALTDNTAEIRQAKIFGNSADPLVMSFSKEMLQDRAEANDALIALADAHGMRNATNGQAPQMPYDTAAAHAGSLSPQQEAKNIAALPPVKYFTQQIRTDEQSIALYKREIANGRDAAVVSYARKTLPDLQSQLELARQDVAKEKAEHHD